MCMCTEHVHRVHVHVHVHVYVRVAHPQAQFLRSPPSTFRFMRS